MKTDAVKSDQVFELLCSSPPPGPFPTAPPIPQPLRGSDGWDYNSIADKLLGIKSISDHNINRYANEREFQPTNGGYVDAMRGLLLDGAKKRGPA